MHLGELEESPYVAIWLEKKEIMPCPTPADLDQYAVAFHVPPSVTLPVLAFSYVLMKFVKDQAHGLQFGEFVPLIVDLAYEIGPDGVFALAVFDANLGPAFRKRKDAFDEEHAVAPPLIAHPLEVFPGAGTRRKRLMTTDCLMNVWRRAR